MALSKSIVVGTTVYPHAYIRVVSTNVSKITSLAKVVFYESKNGQQFETKEFGFVSNIEDAAPNALKQAYEHIKKLPEFAGATDC
jgi:hypothetical protein